MTFRARSPMLPHAGWIVGSAGVVAAIAVFAPDGGPFFVVGAGCAFLLLVAVRPQHWDLPRTLGIVAVWGPPLVAMAGYLWSNGGALASGYVTLRILEFVGLAIGSAAQLTRYRAGAPRVRPWREQRVMLLIIYAAGAGCGLMFLALEGSPLLTGAVETARAEAGAGYLRVPAHLVLPSAILLFASHDRRRWLAVVGAFVMIAAMGNRSPLVYLIGGVVLTSVLERDTAGRTRNTLPRLLAGGVVALTVVMVGATVRILSTSEYASYEEFRDPIADRDYIQIAAVSLKHYAGTVGDNAVLTKDLRDSGAIEEQYGRSYLMPFLTALPGRQETLDLTIKRVSGSTFIGGGTPPTLGGEGYVNFGAPGTVLGAAALAALIAQASRRFRALRTPVSGAILAFMFVYSFMAQVAGFAGASGIPLLTLLCLLAFDRLGYSGKRSSRGSSV